ncbi:IS3 family transposase [Bradyrhizobium sp. PMVTL-01]|uniref:IS3 family transposase n=1 Tax=Bradyrhizobium sp. PMVTL-01 TaxID=3434999 RepID=UPI003F70B8C0
MSAPDRRGLLQRDQENLSIRRLCQLQRVAQSSIYRLPQPANDNDNHIELIRQADRLFTASPVLGPRRMMAMLNGEGCRINRKRVQPLMRNMGIAAPGRRDTRRSCLALYRASLAEPPCNFSPALAPANGTRMDAEREA